MSKQSGSFEKWWQEHASDSEVYFGLSRAQVAFIYHSAYDDAINNVKKTFLDNCKFEEANS